MFCSNCGSEIEDSSSFCTGCGWKNEGKASKKSKASPDLEVSPKNKTVAALLAIFLGWCGAHRFYVGKVWTGVLMFLLSFIWIGIIWAIIDFVMILTGKFTDSDGFLLKDSKG